MMNDCQNVEIREALPELVHGTLPEIDRARVQQHLDDCDDCSAELAIIRAVRGSFTVSTAMIAKVDVARIVAAVPPYRRKQSRVKRMYLELAAACVIGAIGISGLAIHNSRSAAIVAGSAAHAGSVAAPGLALVNTSDLSDDGLAQLTHDLDQLQAMPTADPESVTPVALEENTAPVSVDGNPRDSA